MNKDEELRILEEFGRQMEQSFEEWYREHQDEIQPPPLDLSFMEQNPELPAVRNENDEEDHGQHRSVPCSAEPPRPSSFRARSASQPAAEPAPASSPAPRRPRWHSFRNVAAIFLAVVVLSAGMTAWVNSQSAHALKFRIEKLFHENEDHRYSTEETESEGNNVISMNVSKPEELDSVRRQIPELRIPETLPEGYAFSSAKAECRDDGSWTAQLQYQHTGGQTIVISEENPPELPEEDLKPVTAGSAAGPGQLFEVDKPQKGSEFLYIAEDVTVRISGTADRDELLRLAEGLE